MNIFITIWYSKDSPGVPKVTSYQSEQQMLDHVNALLLDEKSGGDMIYTGRLEHVHRRKVVTEKTNILNGDLDAKISQSVQG